ncbi:GIY-YIG nuclease family protein [Campylobacter concisus]|uniref:GIY-YIG nuclease family protein n=1 Tax=Campylobacter concisus TaxID=199 RepID=UPI000D3ADD62|nr:GIY-YIG nuclease family protein [Campylobacter concisus]
MANYQSIDEILNDPFFVDILKETPKKSQPTSEDEIIFESINEFISKNNALPQKAKIGSNERKLYNALEGIRSDPKKCKELKPLDKFNLLGTVLERDDNLPTMLKDDFTSLDDALAGLGDIIDLPDLADSLLDVSDIKKPKQKRLQPKDYAQTKRMENFDEYKEIFSRIHSQISSGARKLIPVGNSQDIKAGDLFILKGVMLYIEDKSDDFKSQSGQKNSKLKVIYENGTYADLRLNSLAAGFRRSDSYRVEANSDSAKDVSTGFIYVLKSLSDNEQILNIKNLYKIGVTAQNSIRERIANAQNEPTYLYAPVEIVREYEVKNFNPQKLEVALHHMLSQKRLQTEITLPNGKIVKPQEWFVVKLEEIEEAINDIILKMQIQ